MKSYYIEQDVCMKDESNCISLVLDLGTSEDVYLGIFIDSGEFLPMANMILDMDDIKEVLKVQQQIFHNGFDAVYTHNTI